MDKVRLGRALGYGARHAAKTVMGVVEAATAPDPRARPVAAPKPGPQKWGESRDQGHPVPTASAAWQAVGEAQRTVAQTKTAVRTETKKLGRGVFAPVKQFAGVLWLQVTGTLFSFIALFMAEGMWMRRQGLRQGLNSPDAMRFYLHAGVFVVFAYFAVSSFVRVGKKQGR